MRQPSPIEWTESQSKQGVIRQTCVTYICLPMTIPCAIPYKHPCIPHQTEQLVLTLDTDKQLQTLLIIAGRFLWTFLYKSFLLPFKSFNLSSILQFNNGMNPIMAKSLFQPTQSIQASGNHAPEGQNISILSLLARIILQLSIQPSSPIVCLSNCFPN